MADPTYPLFPVFAFLGFIIAIIPLPWHFEAWNAGTCLYMMWTAIACLNQFINSIVWHDNAINSAPVWCDISTRIILGSAVGIPASALCIARRLYNISNVQTVKISWSEKRRAVLIDIVIAVFFPLICVALAYIVQGHRFNIVEDIGCLPDIYNTLPSYFLVSMWPILIGLISAVYCTLSIRSFMKKQSRLDQFLPSSSGLTASRYLRLMALASIEILCTTPLSAFSVFLNVTGSTIEPWKSWSDTHFNFSRVDQIPALLWRSSHITVVSLELTRWLPVVCAIIFFGFFGFAEEARKHYRLLWRYFAKRLGYTYATSSKTSTQPSGFLKPLNARTTLSSDGTLPVFITNSAARYEKHYSSSTDALSVDKRLTSYPNDTVLPPLGYASSLAYENPVSPSSEPLSFSDHVSNLPRYSTYSIATVSPSTPDRSSNTHTNYIVP